MRTTLHQLRGTLTKTMIMGKAILSDRIRGLALSLALCCLPGCSKDPAPASGVTVTLAQVKTNASGEIQAQLNLTNTSSISVLVGVRSLIHGEMGARTTNFGIHAPFVGLAGPGSEASDITLAAGSGMTAALKPFKAPYPFQLEFICFPGRSGPVGIVDKARDKIEEFKDGSRHDTYGGESFVVLSPVIAQPE